MRQQAAHFGAAQLSRAADIVNARPHRDARRHRAPAAARADLRPGAAARGRGRRPAASRPGWTASSGGPTSRARRPSRRPLPRTPVTPSRTPVAGAPGGSRCSGGRPAPAATAEPVRPGRPGAGRRRQRPSRPPTPAAARRGARGRRRSSRRLPAPSTWSTVRRLWPEVLDVVARLKRLTWTLISQNAQVQGVSDGRLTLASVTPGAAGHASCGRSDHQDYVREALIEVLGVDWKVDAIVDPSTAPTEPAAAAPAGPGPPGRRAVRAGRRRGRGGRRGGAEPAYRMSRPPRRPTTRTPTTTRSPTRTCWPASSAPRSSGSTTRAERARRGPLRPPTT